MRERSFAFVLRFLVCAMVAGGVFAKPIFIGNDRGFTLNVGETQSTVVSPGHPSCPGGRLLISNDWVRGTTGSVKWVGLDDPSGTPHDSEFTSVGLDLSLYSFITNDHDLVTTRNRDVYYMTGAASRVPLPGALPPWWKSAYRNGFGPGARSVLLVWRSTDCGQSFQYVSNLEFDPARVEDGLCAFPQPPRRFRHDTTGSKEYLAPFASFAQPGEGHWHFCSKCRQLFLDEPGQASVCPIGGAHKSGGGNYKLIKSAVPGLAEETGWKHCKSCGVVFSGSGGVSSCPARRGHDGSESSSYPLIKDTKGDPALEAGFHWCDKCQGLFSGADTGSSCPVGGWHHAGGNYQVALSAFAGNGEEGWRVCSKCKTLFLDKPGKASACPKGGAHDGASSKSYKMLTAPPPGFMTQGDWKWCDLCGGLFFSANASSSCPIVRGHDGSGSADYHMPVGSASAPAGLQPAWHRCNKCQGLTIGDTLTSSCPIGGAGNDFPLFDMGGSDGQLIKVDRANSRVYLTFQCVGFTHDAAEAKFFELTDTQILRTVVAMSELGAPWKVLGDVNRRAWRMGVVPIGKDDVAFGFAEVVVMGKLAGSSMTFATAAQAGQNMGWPREVAVEKSHGFIKTYKFMHTIATRTPGTNNVLLIIPDQFANQRGGYHLFFFDRVSRTFTEAIDRPILADDPGTDSFVFHLQAVDLGTGPVLLYWNDYDSSTQRITVRARLVTGEAQMSGDFAISRANGQARSFDVSATPDYWYGDYQTAGGYIVGTGPRKYIFHPVWVEPGQQVRFGDFEYDEASGTQQVMKAKVRRLPAKAADLSTLPLSIQEIENLEKERDH